MRHFWHSVIVLIAGMILVGSPGIHAVHSVRAQTVNDMALILKGKITGTGQLERITYSGNVIAGGGINNEYVRMIDVSDITAPKLTYSHELDGRFYGICSNGSNVFSCDYNTSPREGWLEVIDITDPSEPNMQAHYRTRDLALGVDVDGDTVVVADDDKGLTVIDISKPSKPSVIGSYFQANAETIAISGTLVALREATSDNHRLHLYDISNPEAIRHLSVFALPNGLSEIVFDGALMYLAHHDGVDIYVVSDPVSPEKIGSISGIGLTYGIDPVGTKLYVANGDLLRVYDITNPTEPWLQASCKVDGYAQSVRVFDSHIAVGMEDSLQIYDLQAAYKKDLVQKGLYTGTGGLRHLSAAGNVIAGGIAGNDKIQFFDIADPVNPRLAYSYLINDNCSDVVANGTFIYVNRYSRSPRHGFLDIFDVADPYSPSLVCHYETRDVAVGIALIDPHLLFLADDDAGVDLIDVSDFNKPRMVDYLSQLNATFTSASGELAAAGDATYNANRVYVYDLSSKTNINRLGWISVLGVMNALAFEGTTICTAQNTKGVMIIDATNPAKPVLASRIGDAEPAISLDMVGNSLYVACGQDLRIYDVSDPSYPRWLYGCNTDGQALDVSVMGDYIYVGTRDSLQVFMLQDQVLSLTYLTEGPYIQDSTLRLYWTSDLVRSGQAVKFELMNNNGKLFDLGYAWNENGHDVSEFVLPGIPSGKYWIRISSAYDSSLYVLGNPFEFQASNFVHDGWWFEYQ